MNQINLTRCDFCRRVFHPQGGLVGHRCKSAPVSKFDEIHERLSDDIQASSLEDSQANGNRASANDGEKGCGADEGVGEGDDDDDDGAGDGSDEAFEDDYGDGDGVSYGDHGSGYDGESGDSESVHDFDAADGDADADGVDGDDDDDDDDDSNDDEVGAEEADAESSLVEVNQKGRYARTKCILLSCGQTHADIFQHYRTVHDNFRGMPESQMRAAEFAKCVCCFGFYKPKGLKNHMKKCNSTPPQPPRQESQSLVFPMPTAPTSPHSIPNSPSSTQQDYIPAPQPYQPSALPTPPSDSSAPIPPSPTPPSHQTAPITSAPVPEIPTWADDICLKDVLPLQIPKNIHRLRKPFFGAVDRTAELAVQTKDPRAMKLLFLLVRVGFAGWAGKRWRSTSKRILEHYPKLPHGLDVQVEDALKNQVRRQEPRRDTETERHRGVQAAIKDGHLKKATSILLGDGLKKVDQETLQKLQELHPQGPSEPFAGPIRHADTGLADKNLMEKAINRLPRDSAPGPSGWTFALITDAFHQAPHLRTALEMLALWILTDSSKLNTIRDYITSSRLVALNKKGGGVRPIAVGESITRFISRWILESVSPKFEDLLLPCQFGVGSAGGVEPIVHYLNDTVRVNQAEAIVSIDFSNAFNELSRKEMKNAVAAHLPGLYRAIKFLYGQPSNLYTWKEDGDLCAIQSSQGVRQGDPFGPLLFSLTVRPLIEDLQKWDAVVSERGVVAYLDDIFIHANEGTKDMIVNYLQSTDVVERYNLRVNVQKTKEYPVEELARTPVNVLGSLVGGTTNPATNPEGEKAAIEAAEKLEERTTTLERLTLQERLLLLRLCFFPTLNHIIRSSHPNLTEKGARKFDNIVEATIARWAAVEDQGLPAESTEVLHLPVRFGGLGMFRQRSIREIAFASSYVLSQAVLRKRNKVLSETTALHMEPYVQLCANHLDLPATELLADDEALRKNIQRRALALTHERSFKTLYDDLYDRSPEKCNRLAEGSTILARCWLNLLPTDRGSTLADYDVVYGLRRTLLLPCHQSPPQGICKCGVNSSSMHHLVCGHAGKLRTYRHHAVVDVLLRYLRQVSANVDKEFNEGGKRHDLAIDTETNRLLCDVGIASVHYEDRPSYPQENEIQQKIADNHLQEHETEFFFEDRRDEEENQEVVWLRAFRQIAERNSLGVVGKMLAKKRQEFFAKYHPMEGELSGQFHGFILSAGGGSTSDVSWLLRWAVRKRGGRTRDRVVFRRDLSGRLSLVLVRYASIMSRARALKSLS